MEDNTTPDSLLSIKSRSNNQQLEAIKHGIGPLLMIAGPGSGKTFTLVERIVFLITQEKIPPNNLLVLTFTDKAAAELRTRVSTRLTESQVRFNLNEMYIGTFHSTCLSLLEDYRVFTRLKRNFTLLDQFDQEFFLYQRLSNYENIPHLEEIIGAKGKISVWERSQKLCQWINKISEEGIHPEKLKGSQDSRVKSLGEALGLYQQQLEEENALDFSTIQYETLKLLQSYPHVVRELRDQFRYVMVDEYQDTNTLQELLLTELCDSKSPNLCVVGDDDQGLYRFRGASIRNILEFRQKFPEGVCRPVTLITNYRSHPDIISLYNSWMQEQEWDFNGKSFRLSKQIVPREDEFIDTPTTKKEYSFTSHITLFENCAEQFRFFKALEFAPIRTSPVLFGVLVHQTIEDIHKTVLRGEEHRVNEDQIESWFEVNHAALTKKERVYLTEWARRAALEQALRYYRRERHDWSRLREAEVDVSLVKDDYILSGTVDLIKGDDDTVEIVDFKSEKKPDIHTEREKLDRYRRQLEVYAHLIEERTGLKVSKTHLYYTSVESGNPYISFPKDDKSIDLTIAAFDSVVRRIEGKDFSLKERPKKLCQNCDMRFYCDAKEKTGSSRG